MTSRLAVLALGLASLPLAFAQVPDGATLISQAEAALKQYRTVQFSLDRTFEVSLASTKKRLTDRTSVIFVNPGRMRIESKGQFANHLLVSDTGGTWIYDFVARNYWQIPVVMDLSLSVFSLGLPTNPGMALMPLSPVTVSQVTVTIDGQKHDCWVVQDSGLGEFGNGEYREPVWTLWLDKKTGVDLKSTFSARLLVSGAWCQMDITSVKHSLKLNASVPESRFTFVVPKDGKAGNNGQLTGSSDLFFDTYLSGKLNLAEMGFQQGDEPIEMEGHRVLFAYAPLWCDLCRKSMPVLEKLYREYMAQGLIVVQYTAALDLASLEKSLQASPVPYFVVYGPENRGDFKISGYPTFIAVNKDGNVVGSQTGFGSEPGYDETALRQLLMRTGLGLQTIPRQDSKKTSKRRKKIDKPGATPPP